MKPILVIGLLAVSSLAAFAQTKPQAIEKVTSEQLTSRLASGANDDAHVAADLATLQLTERLSPDKFAQFSAALPGEKSRQALLILADSAALLDPPSADVVPNPPPDAAALRQMLVNVVSYANSSLHGLPNFVATRATTAFEDRPAEDTLEPTGIVSYSYLPLHFVSQKSVQVAYRSGSEVIEASGKDERKSAPAHGLQTAGEFGPFLSTVLADAVKGKITWARWEKAADGPLAVFHYQVKQDASHYLVQFCCVREDISESIATHIFSEKTAYEGELAFNPATSAVRRISVQAALAPGELVDTAGMVVQYEPVQVGGKMVVLPVKSVSILKAHTNAPPQGMHMAVFKGPAKTFLNDVTFGNYHQYRGEMRMVSDSAAPAPQ